MTSTIFENDVDISLFEDEEFEIICDIHSLSQEDYGYPRCQGDPARWIAWRPGCCPAPPRYRLICDDCKRVYQKWQAHNGAIFCRECHTETGGFVSFVPLKKSS